MTEELSASDRTLALRAALRKKFTAPEWVLIEEVRNETGYKGGSRRSADALAMNMYPSRGLCIRGFEIKVLRSDLVKELSSPEKAEAIARYCDEWWLVLDDADLMKGLDIPKAWGVLVLDPRHGLRAVKAAEQNEHVEVPTKGFMAACLRRAAEILKDVVPRSEVTELVHREAAALADANLEYAKQDAEYSRIHGRQLVEERDRLDRQFEAYFGMTPGLLLSEIAAKPALAPVLRGLIKSGVGADDLDVLKAILKRQSLALNVLQSKINDAIAHADRIEVTP